MTTAMMFNVGRQYTFFLRGKYAKPLFTSNSSAIISVLSVSPVQPVNYQDQTTKRTIHNKVRRAMRFGHHSSTNSNRSASTATTGTGLFLDLDLHYFQQKHIMSGSGGESYPASLTLRNISSRPRCRTTNYYFSIIKQKFHTSHHQYDSDNGQVVSLSDKDLRTAMQSLTDQFMEARELLEDARESMDTVYFSDDMQDAQEAVSNTLKEYKELLLKLSEKQKEDVIRTIGLRMEELKAQEQAINESLV